MTKNFPASNQSSKLSLSCLLINFPCFLFHILFSCNYPRWFYFGRGNLWRMSEEIKVFVNNMKIWKWILNDDGNKFHWTWNLFNRTTVKKATDSKLLHVSRTRQSSDRFWFPGIFTCTNQFLVFFETMKYKWIHINFKSSLGDFSRAEFVKRNFFFLFILNR